MSIIPRLFPQFKDAVRSVPTAATNPAEPDPDATRAALEADYRFGRKLALEPEADISLLDSIPATADGYNARLDGWNDERRQAVERTRAWIREMSGAADVVEWDRATNWGCH